MPTPDRTSLEEIVQAGRDILESVGSAALTMQAVAERVGVRAPSLYKRVRNRDDLVRLIIEATLRDLGEQLSTLGTGGDPRRDLAVLARAFRGYAHARPMAYQLIFGPARDVGNPSTAALNHAVEPLLRVAVALAGERHALAAARTFTAWANGFISMELSGAFQLGGDVDEAFEYGIARLTAALDGEPVEAPETQAPRNGTARAKATPSNAPLRNATPNKATPKKAAPNKVTRK